MEAFKKITGIIAPLDRVNVDTDQIIPKQFLKRIEKTGFNDALFYDWRIKPDGSPDPDFVLNKEPYTQASILVAGRNFGSGSSREHAPWALKDFGFRAIIAPSFADIFRNNCFQNGLLPIELPEEAVNELIERAQKYPGYSLTIDLEKNEISDDEVFLMKFEVDDFRRYCLLNGLDDIAMTLQHEEKIEAFEARREQAAASR
ncbi:MAG TPA: 3-isopropylmalate dehydratase small subunit [Dehalococcoidia bacterium]|nr:3-isopropylmalate dehydratase small subunit [Dehalococcoidia bacterium]